MSALELFFDSSALFAGVVSADGAARAPLRLGEAGRVLVTVSEQVLAETERALALKRPEALPYFRQALRASGLRIVRDPSLADVAAHRHMIVHEPDVPILVAAMQAGVGFLVTLNRRHFLADPRVAQQSGLRIGTPGNALAWVRAALGVARE